MYNTYTQTLLPSVTSFSWSKHLSSNSLTTVRMHQTALLILIRYKRWGGRVKEGRRKPDIKDFTPQVLLSPKIFSDIPEGMRWVGTKL